MFISNKVYLFGQTNIQIPYIVDGKSFKANVSAYLSLRECNDVKSLQMNNLDGSINWDVEAINFPCVNFEISQVQWQLPEHNKLQMRVTVAPPSQRSGLRGITALSKILEAGKEDNIRLGIDGNSARRASLTITFTPIVITDPKQDQVIIHQRYRITNYTFPSEVPSFKPDQNQKETDEVEDEEKKTEKEAEDESLVTQKKSDESVSDTEKRNARQNETDKHSISQQKNATTKEHINEPDAKEQIPPQFKPEYRVEKHANVFFVRFSNLNTSFQVTLQQEDSEAFYLIEQDESSFSVFVDNDIRNYAIVAFTGVRDTLQIPFYSGAESFETVFNIDRRHLTIDIQGGEAPYLMRFLRSGLQFPLHEIEIKSSGEHQIPLREIRTNVTGKVNIEILDAQRMSVQTYEGVVIPGSWFSPRVIFITLLILVIGGVAYWKFYKRKELIQEDTSTSEYDIESAKDRMRKSIRRNIKST